jgi:hypothetical protein
MFNTEALPGEGGCFKEILFLRLLTVRTLPARTQMTFASKSEEKTWKGPSKIETNQVKGNKYYWVM